MATFTTSVTVPTFLRDKANGQLLSEWLRSPDGTSAMSRRLFTPVSYAMQAMHYAAEADGVELRTTGRYRDYDRQVALFLERYSPVPIPGRPTKTWNGATWWQKPGVAMAATPGTSNHGLGLADDLAEEDSTPPDNVPESLGWDDIGWIDAHQAGFGFGLETTKEQWHRHWVGGDALSQLVVDVLHANGVTVPDLSAFGFTVPAPAPTPPPSPDPGVDDMTQEEHDMLVKVHNALFVDDSIQPGYPSFFTMLNQTRSAVFPNGVVDASGKVMANVGVLAKRIAVKLGVPAT